MKCLLKLYLSFHISKLTYFVFFLILIIWMLALLLNAGIPLDEVDYSLCPKNYHSMYFEQSFFLMQMLNGVIVAFLVGSEVHSLSLFDPMFVTNGGRGKVVLSKLFANGIILFMMEVFEVLLLYLVASITYSRFIFTLKSLLLVGIAMLPMIELLLFGEFFSILFHSHFIPILIFVFHIFMSLILKMKTLNNLDIFFLIIDINDRGEGQIQGNIYVYSGICLLMIMGILFLFQKKDISC